jgi:hypothetical protein
MAWKNIKQRSLGLTFSRSIIRVSGGEICLQSGSGHVCLKIEFMCQF